MLDVGDPVARRQETFMRAWASRQNKAPNSKPSAEESLGKGNLGGTSKILLHELSAQAWHAKGFLNPSLYFYSSYHWEEWDLCRTQLFVHLRQSFYYSPCSHASQVQEANFIKRHLPWDWTLAIFQHVFCLVLTTSPWDTQSHSYLAGEDTWPQRSCTHF